MGGKGSGRKSAIAQQDFCEAWNAADSLGAVCESLGVTKNYASVRASGLRKNGTVLKTHHKAGPGRPPQKHWSRLATLAAAWRGAGKAASVSQAVLLDLIDGGKAGVLRRQLCEKHASATARIREWRQRGAAIEFVQTGDAPAYHLDPASVTNATFGRFFK